MYLEKTGAKCAVNETFKKNLILSSQDLFKLSGEAHRVSLQRKRFHSDVTLMGHSAEQGASAIKTFFLRKTALIMMNTKKRRQLENNYSSAQPTIMYDWNSQIKI